MGPVRLKSMIKRLKMSIINVADVFVYDYPIWSVTLGGHTHYICCGGSEQDALDGVVDHLEGIKELDFFVYSAEDLEQMEDSEIETLTCVGNHCYYLNCEFKVEAI